MPEPVFLKLGGSLITDKSRENTFKPDICRRLGEEIRSALSIIDSPLLIGHGAGSFGHYAAKKYRTDEGLPGGGGWRGYSATRRSVIALNKLILDTFAEADFFPASVPPSACGLASEGELKDMDLKVINRLLSHGQTPMVCGDALLDEKRGFTICSTEDIFEFLATRLGAGRILLACDVDGIIAGDPFLPSADSQRIEKVTAANIDATLREITLSAPNDVTGGMTGKVKSLMRMAETTKVNEIRIFSGLIEGAVESALLEDYRGGTVISLK